MGGVEEAGVADDEVSGSDRDIDFVRIFLKGGVVLVGALDVVGVSGRKGVQPMSVSMRSGNDSQAPVLTMGVDEVIHQKKLVGRIRIADRLGPEDAVLVPEERGGNFRWFADDIAAVEPGIRISEVREDVERGRQRDQGQHLFVVVDADQGSLMPSTLLLFFGKVICPRVGFFSDVFDQIRWGHLRYVAVAVLDQLTAELFGKGALRFQSWSL